MGETTAISWADHTFNPWMGCTKVSPACDGCYAEHLVEHRFGKAQWGGPGRGAGTRARTSEANWRQPLAWDRKAAATGTRPFVFCASLADVFDNEVPEEWRRDLFRLIYSTPRLVWLLLTKRPQNIARMSVVAGALPANAAIGTTIEDQRRADLNMPALIAAGDRLAPAFLFISAEPLLGQIVLRNEWLERLGWIISGGETDQGSHKARPTHPEWFRSLRDQAAAAGIPFHHKQNGEWITGADAFARGIIPAAEHHPWGLMQPAMARVGKMLSGRILDGALHDARPVL